MINSWFLPSKGMFLELLLFISLAIVSVSMAAAAAATAEGTVSSSNIVIEGAPELLSKNIRSTLSVVNELCSASLERLQSLNRTIEQEIQQSSRALGYYHSAAVFDFELTETCWQLEIAIEAGPRVTLEKVQIVMSPLISEQDSYKKVLEANPLTVGDFLNHRNYDAVKSAISAAAVDNGFFSARFTQSEIAVDTTNNTAAITLVFEEGMQFRIGEINLDNDSPLNEGFVRRLMATNKGEAYSSARMLKLRENLNNSLYFSAIRVTPNFTNNANGQIPILVALQQKPRHVYSAGVGFTTDTGPRLSLDYDDRFINSKGHRLEADLDLSQVRQEFDTSYQIPVKDVSRQLLEFRFGVLQEDNDSYSSTRFNLDTNYRHDLKNGWLANLFVSYQEDDYEVNNQIDLSRLTMLGVSMSKTRADNLVFPSKGWHLFAQLRGASDSLLSDTTFLQAELISRYIHSLTENSRLLLRMDTGTTLISDETELPASIRFFAGGDQSLRGYKYQTLGPMDENGEVVGGKHLLSGSVELDFRIKGKWRGAIFYDGGNAFSKFSDINWQHSVGFGARWLSPIGPIRLDLAHPIEKGGVRLHISMGPDL